MSRRKHEAHDDVLDAMLWADLPAFRSNRKVSHGSRDTIIGLWLLIGWGLGLFLLWLKFYSFGVMILAAWALTITILNCHRRASRSPPKRRSGIRLFFDGPAGPREAGYMIAPGIDVVGIGFCPIQITRILPVNPSPRYSCSKCGLRFDLDILPKNCPACRASYSQNASDVSNVKEE